MNLSSAEEQILNHILNKDKLRNSGCLYEGLLTVLIWNENITKNDDNDNVDSSVNFLLC
jgi:hypothetical protein